MHLHFRKSASASTPKTSKHSIVRHTDLSTMEKKVTIEIKRFGQILTSRPEGREAALILLASELRQRPESVELNFEEVLVLTPSWLGEFVNTLNNAEIKQIRYSHSENGSVTSSVEMTQ